MGCFELVLPEDQGHGVLREHHHLSHCRKGLNNDAVHDLPAGAFVPPPATATGCFVQAIKFKS